MSILGKTPAACFKAFVDHLNPLVQATLPIVTPLQASIVDTNTAILGFRGGIYTVPLATKAHGTIYLHIGQLLECTASTKRSANERFKLGTRKYWYRVQGADDKDADAIVRWEYVSPHLPEYAGKNKRHCWRHIQMPHALPLPSGALDLDKAHLPSGYVIVEDIIRFLIQDLGVKPPCGNQWHAELVASETVFWKQFNSR